MIKGVLRGLKGFFFITWGDSRPTGLYSLVVCNWLKYLKLAIVLLFSNIDY